MPSNTMANPMGGDGWGQTARYYRPNGAVGTNPSGNKNWFGSNAETTVHVYAGGTLNNSGGTITGINSGIGPIGHLGYDIDSKSGPVFVSVAGTYSMGSTASNGTGGGFLQLRGYHASTTITMGSLTITPAREALGLSPYADLSTGMTGNYGLYATSTGDSTAPPNVVPVTGPGGNYLSQLFPITSPLVFDSEAPELRVELTAQNTGGLFNPIVVTGTLTMTTLASNVNYNKLAEFKLTLNGYTPVTGDTFTIITAPGGVTGGGMFQQGWNTNFNVGGYLFQLHNTPTGVTLEVTRGGPTYQLWIAGYNLAGGGTDDPAFDYDNDGLLNGIEYILGGDPTAGDTGGLVTAVIEPNVLFSFNQAISAKTDDVEVYIDVRPSLISGNWTPYEVGVAPEITVSPGPAGFETITLTLPLGADISKVAQLRVVVTQ